ncbi:MAG: FtsX-like permease family protein [Spirochaetales bacterium]
MRRASIAAIARRFLFGRPGVSGLSRRVRGGVVGVGLSLIPLVVVLQVTDGMIAGITDRFIEAGSSHIQAVARVEQSEEEVRARIEALGQIEGVELAAYERQGIGLAAARESRTAVTVRAVEPDLLARDPGLEQYLEIQEGAWDLSSDESIVLGSFVADELGLSIGDPVRVLTARPLAGGRFLPRSSSFTVTGIVSTGYADLDRLWVFVPVARGASILPEESSRLIIGLKIGDPLDLPNPLFAAPAGRQETARAIVQEVRDELGTDYRVATWFEADRAKYMSFKTTKDLLIFIMVLIVIVAAVNISSTLVMLVLEKQEEIAILKSMGASPAGIRWVFVGAGFVLGALGTSLGLAVGLLLAVYVNELLWAIEWVINALSSLWAWVFGGTNGGDFELLSADFYLQEIPITIQLEDLLLIAFLSLLLSAAAAYFPARRAARIRPLEVLRRH